MLNDAWFLKVVRAQFEADRRLFRPATLSTEHGFRLLEMAERWHAETAKPVQADDLRGLAGRR